MRAACRAALNAGHITAMTPAPGSPAQPVGSTQGLWTPPTRPDHGVTAIKDTVTEPNPTVGTLMQGGFGSRDGVNRHRKQQELVLSKPLKKLLRQWLSRVNPGLTRPEALSSTSSDWSGVHHPERIDDSATLDVGIFNRCRCRCRRRTARPCRSQQDSYQAWERHYNLHPEELEPGRTVHEMAALKAATQSPISRAGIDQQG